MKLKAEKNYQYLMKRDLVNKNMYETVRVLPVINKVTLHFGCKSDFEKALSPRALALELISGQKASFCAAKKNNAHLKIKKGFVTGVKVELTKSRAARFLTQLSLEVAPNLETKATPKFKLIDGTDVFTFSFPKQELRAFEELEFNRILFTKLGTLVITAMFSSKIMKEDQLFFLNDMTRYCW